VSRCAGRARSAFAMPPHPVAVGIDDVTALQPLCPLAIAMGTHGAYQGEAQDHCNARNMLCLFGCGCLASVGLVHAELGLNRAKPLQRMPAYLRKRMG
jgi:hypothetical protein